MFPKSFTIALALLLGLCASPQTSLANVPPNPLDSTSEPAASPVKLRSQAELLAFLDRYIGTWHGTYTLTLPDGQVLMQMRVVHEYLWIEDNGERLVAARTVYGNGERQSEAVGLIAVRQGKLIMQLTQDGSLEHYQGRVLEDMTGVTWVPTDLSEALSERIEERFVRNADGVMQLLTEAYEDYENEEIRTRLHLSGEAEKVTE